VSTPERSVWLPSSGCGTGCLPGAGTTPVVGAAVRLRRAAGLVAIVAAVAALLPVLPLLAPSRRAGVLRAAARAALRALGVRVRVRGRLPERRALLAANHISWLDILAVLAHTPARLVAKSEVRRWPLIGRVAAATGAIFIDRSRPRRLPRAVREVAEAMRAGAVVAAFPAGTTGCGASPGRFRPALFQAAIDAGAPVAPVTLSFMLVDGSPTTAAAFVGDDTLLRSLRRVLAVDGLTMEMAVGAVVHPDVAATRRALARISGESTIALYRVFG
jgi:1-acyl-sn-glycerol-3-phosphate acyltransferase